MDMAELNDAIKLYEVKASSAEDYIKLAAFYTVREHNTPTEKPVSAAPIMPVSAAPEPIVRSVSYAGEPKSDFLELVATKDANRAWEVMDRIMDELKVINPKSYDGYMARLRAI